MQRLMIVKQVPFIKMKIIGFLGFIIVIGISFFLQNMLGDTAVVRYWGVVIVGVTLVMSFMPEIPVFVKGNEEPSVILKGWNKALFLVCLSLIGLLIAIYPHEVACAINLKGYKCI